MYTGPVGSAILTEQIHDYNVHIDSNDVFWMVPVGQDAVKVDFNGARASLQVSGLSVFDDHDLANSVTQGLGLPGDPHYGRTKHGSYICLSDAQSQGYRHARGYGERRHDRRHAALSP